MHYLHCYCYHGVVVVSLSHCCSFCHSRYHHPHFRIFYQPDVIYTWTSTCTCFDYCTKWRRKRFVHSTINLCIWFLVTSEKNHDFQIISTFGIRLMEVASLEKIGRIIIRLTGTKKSTPTFIGNWLRVCKSQRDFNSNAGYQEAAKF